MAKIKKPRPSTDTRPASAQEPLLEAEKATPAAARLPAKEDLPSSQQLLRSTAIAAGVALVLLLVAVLPAEYGIDPLGIGRVLGLTQMGEMKMQLAKEAAAPDPTTAPAPAAAAPTAPASADAVSTAAPPAAAEPASSANAATKSDVTKITLAPNQSKEVKLSMAPGAKATFQWSVEGGQVNYDLHADKPDGGGYHGYKKGKGATSDEGELVAAFDGYHGWFWRNKSSGDVTITLKTKGDYREVKEM